MNEPNLNSQFQISAPNGVLSVQKWLQFPDPQTDSFYPAMRLLLPHLEKERIAYGIKEVSNLSQATGIYNISTNSKVTGPSISL